jgi:hypothetical protein
MSENSMTQNPMTQAPPPAAEPADGNRRKALVAGGLVAALALGGGGYLLMSGGSSDDSGFVVPSARKSTTGASTVTKATTSTAAKPAVRTVPAVTSLRIGRDPFKPLYVEPVEQAAAPPPSGNTTDSNQNQTGYGTGPTYPLTLKKVTTSGDAKLYTFSVAGTSKTVLAAQRFGKYGELIVLGWIKNSKGGVAGAVIQVGDGEPVVIDLGQEISVQ